MDFSNDFPKPSQPFPPPPVTGTPVGQPPNDPQYVGVNTVRPVTLVQAGPWSTGLCDCCENVPNCCLTCWCPCVTFGQVAEIVDRGSNSCGVSGALYVLISAITGCACIYSCFYRTKMRKQYMLPESPCADFLVHCCCEPCALCQEYRELEHRGFDMTLGWDGNVARQNDGVSMPPIVPEGMMK